MVVSMISMLAALVAVSVRQCGEDLQGTLNEQYVPLDQLRSDFETYNKLKESGLLPPKR